MKDAHQLKPWQFKPTKYDTKRLKEQAEAKLRSGMSDTEVAKWLMWDEGVLLYSANKFIRDAKKRLNSAS
jgi:hypothetical protein